MFLMVRWDCRHERILPGTVRVDEWSFGHWHPWASSLHRCVVACNACYAWNAYIARVVVQCRGRGLVQKSATCNGRCPGKAPTHGQWTWPCDESTHNEERQPCDFSARP